MAGAAELPAQLRSAYRKLAELVPSGGVGVVIAHDADLVVLELHAVSRARAVEICGELEASRIAARLRREPPPAGFLYVLLMVPSYGVTIAAIEQPSFTNAPGGEA
ncbi:hypothetical protein [Sorangium sp. So ce1335]|uniref:hypothetical protein n=1 Tax=Sorangium sp. So ce1335 TaxID=3133335 RepID=UPI003F5DCFBF